jgi:methyl-accepting chemotaxis protein
MATTRRKVSNSNASQIEETNLIEGNNTAIDPSPQLLLEALKAAKDGNFAVRLPTGKNGLGELAIVFNEWMATNEQFANEIIQVSQTVGEEGQLSERIALKQNSGSWTTSAHAINTLINRLVKPTTEVERVIGAIAQGDFSQKIVLDTDGSPLKGELLHVGTIVNHLVDHLSLFATDITRVAREIGEGKLDAQITIDQTSGLWQDMIDNLNAMSSKLVTQIRSTAEVTLTVARGDLSQQIKVQNAGELKELTSNVNQMITNLRTSIAQMAEVAIAASSSSEELTAVSKEMTANASQTADQATAASASAEQISQNTETVATAVEEMNASIREIARNAAEGAKVATEAVKTADSTSQTMTKLGQSSLEIGKVIKVITSIAQQTNLLALNATIEAARAGEAGRGFAVVANEVKELAKQTATATEDISQRIEAIQTDTNGAIQAIVQIADIIGRINDLQSTIATAVEEQTATTNEISRNVAEVAKGTSDIAKSIGIVATNAQTTTIGASNTSQSANELNRMAVDLQKVVSQFKY